VAIRKGERIFTFRQDLRVLLNERFYLPLLSVPFFGLLLFTVMPLIFMVLIAFTNYDYAHMPPGKLFDWVGISNFKAMFSLSGGTSGFAFVFLRVLLWTFVWAFFATFSNYFLGLIIALMINKKGIRLKALWRTLFVIAIAIPQFVTLLLMQKILDGDGILNKLLGTNILWLTDQRNFALLPRLMIILVNIWIGVPYTLLMCSGILMNIPTDYYEAARIDGAGVVRIFFAITLPYMLFITTPYLITQFVGNINNFNVIWLLTGGGPVDNVYYGGGTQAQSTDLLVTWLYRLTTDQNPKYNVASVIGIVIFVICAVLSLITFNRTASAKNEGAFQ
jgi:arabinogalactan oligomer/maltooligosaccharide transport system permease protein